MRTIKTKRKALLTSIFATFAVCAVGGLCAVTAVEASASTATVATVQAASVRIAEATDSGIRFAAKIDDYDPTDTSVKYGMLIVPYELVDDYSDNYIEQLETAYPTVDFAYEYCVPYQAGKTIADFNDQEGYYIVSSLIDLNDGNYTRDFVAISYTEVDGARTYVSDWEGCKRNITQVANVVYDYYDPAEEDGQAKIAILDTFLDKGLVEKGLDPATYEIPLTDTSFEIAKDEEISIVDAEHPMYLVYTVDDDSVVKVADGKIVGVGGGEATVTARYGKYTAECTVFVTDPTIYDAENGSMGVTTAQIGDPHIVTLTENGVNRNAFSVSTGNNAYYAEMTIQTKQDLSNVDSISYAIKIAGTNGLFYLPNVPGSAQTRSNDHYALTSAFLGSDKETLTAEDGWTTVTVSGLKGTNTKSPKDSSNSISYNEETGYYSITLKWIWRSALTGGDAITAYLDDFKVESRFDAEMIDSCDNISTIATGLGSAFQSTNHVVGSIVTDDERGSVLQVAIDGSDYYPAIKITTSMDLSAYTSAESTFSLTYWVKVKETGNGKGLYYLPAVPGNTNNKHDAAWTYTNELLEKDTLATTDGWTQVTVSGLYVGVCCGDYKGITDNGDGTYSIYFYYFTRTAAAEKTTGTILMDDVKIAK